MAEAQRRQSASPSTSSYSNSYSERPQERSSASPSRSYESRPRQISPDLVRAGEIAAQRAADRQRFDAYAEKCRASGRLGQPECGHAKEALLADAMTQDLMRRMGSKAWADFRLFNRIQPGFEQDVRRMHAQAERAERAQEGWVRGVPYEGAASPQAPGGQSPPR